MLHYFEKSFPRARQAGNFPGKYLDIMQSYVSENKWCILEAPHEKLIHNDINFDNILIRDDQVVGLLDFDDAEIAPPESDIWGLVFAATDAHNDYSALPAPVIWLRERAPGCFRGRGVYERFVIDQIYGILVNLTGSFSWQTDAEAVHSAYEDYNKIFEDNYYVEWFT